MSRQAQTLVYVEDGSTELPSVYDRSAHAWICGRCGAGTVQAWTGTRCSGCGAEVARVEWRRTALGVAGERLGRRLEFWIPRILGALLVGATILGLTSVVVAATWTDRLILVLSGMALAFALSATVRALSFLLLLLVIVVGLGLVVVRLSLWGWALIL
jgi:hypothetical protein